MSNPLRNLVEYGSTVAALERMSRSWSTSWRTVHANTMSRFCTKTFNINWYRTVWEREALDWITNLKQLLIVDEEDRKSIRWLINSNVTTKFGDLIFVVVTKNLEKISNWNMILFQPSIEFFNFLSNKRKNVTWQIRFVLVLNGLNNWRKTLNILSQAFGPSKTASMHKTFKVSAIFPFNTGLLAVLVTKRVLGNKMYHAGCSADWSWIYNSRFFLLKLPAAPTGLMWPFQGDVVRSLHTEPE